MSQQNPQTWSPEAQELIEEIAFQKVLLESIDDSVVDREAAENEVKDEIKSLELKLRILRRNDKSSQPASSQISPPRRDRNTLSRMSEDKGQADLSEEEDTTPHTGMDSSNQQSSASSMPSTPKSADSLGDLVSPSQMSLPSRKRTHSKVEGSLYPPANNKSRRTSPSRAGPATPSSDISSGDEDLAAFGNQYLLQIQQEEERAKQTRLDEEYARNLSQGFQPSTSASSGSANAFSRLSGAHLLPPSSSIASTPRIEPTTHRTLPWGTQAKAEPRSMSSGIKREGTASNGYTSVYNSRPAIKSEASSSRTIPRVPGAWDDSSAASDSDIEIIPSTAFRGNGRQQTPNFQQPDQSIKRSPGSLAAGHAALNRAVKPENDALNAALFGHDRKSWPAWMTTSVKPEGNPYTGRSGPKSENVYPSHGYTMNNIPAYPGSAAGPSSLAGPPLADYNALNDLISRSGPGHYGDLSRHLGLDSDMDDRLDYIMNDPRKTHQEIKDLLEGIGTGDDLPPEDREGTPDGLVYPLYEHQKIALTWLKSMEEGPKKGGILADDMGLGKTISTLALMLSRPSTDPACKTTLIIGPVALVRQWKNEIEEKIKPGHSLSVLLMHGQNKRPSWDRIRLHDVVLTTYGTLAAEFKRLVKFQEQRIGQDYDQSGMVKEFPILGPKSKFYRVVLDEAQSIKNKLAQSAKAACAIKATHRFCLTGTPMMNNISELFSLIHFLRIPPYNDVKRFNEAFGCITKATRPGRSHADPQKAMQKLQAVIKAIMLRRTKTSLIDGRPIIELPTKTEEIQHVVFDEDEQQFYNALEQKSQVQFNKYLKAGTVTKNYSNVLVLLLRLRQACCHPFLIQDLEQAPTAGGSDLEIMLAWARSLAPEVVERILEHDDAFECPVCYDATENPKLIVPCGHDTCSECLSNMVDSNARENAANGEDGRGNGRTLPCHTCRGNLYVNQTLQVIDYSAFKQVHKAENNPDEDVTVSDNSDSETDSDSDSEEEDEIEEEEEDDADSDGDLRDFVVPDDIDDDSTASENYEVEIEASSKKGKEKAKATTNSKDNIDDDSTEGEDGDDEAERPKKSKVKVGRKSKKSKRSKKDRKGKGKVKNKHISLAMLKTEANKTKAGRARYMRYLKKNWQPSAKITKCVELLEQFRKEGKKTIIFSQFVSLLDLLQVPINEKNWKCLRYDGSMSADERNDAIQHFTKSKSSNIMLISLKAGNAGLNLVAASRVIILDPFWNPFIEMQAVDRAHRIGQRDEVQVHRILIVKTVEDRIIELQEKKRALVESALDEGASKGVGRLGERELRFLFGV